MRRSLHILIFLALAATSAFGELVRQPYPGVRAMGMGNAFLAISNDSNAMWYNPAGLARVNDYHFNLLDTSLGFDSSDTLGRAAATILGGDPNNLIRPDRQFLRGSIRPNFVMPFFSFAIFDHMNAFVEMNNLTAPTDQVDIYAFNDLGFAGAFAVPLGPYVSIGSTVRLFQRTSLDATFTVMDLLNEFGGGVTEADILAAAYDYMADLAGAGLGVAVDLGAMASVPLPRGYPRWTFAAVMNDVGMTSFMPLGDRAPTPVPPTVHFGTALEYDMPYKKSSFNLAFDFRNAFDNINLIKKLNFGVEYKNKFMGIRAGWSQGYISGGFSLEFPPHTRLHFSTYGVELGNSMFEKFQRLYLLQFIIGFNPG